MTVSTKSRFYDLQKNHKQVMDGNAPKNGQEFKVFQNRWGYKKIGCILNWKNGYLHSVPGIPAVQMEDNHTEYWDNGLLSNVELDENGNQMPAVYSDYGETQEYWVNGHRTK